MNATRGPGGGAGRAAPASAAGSGRGGVCLFMCACPCRVPGQGRARGRQPFLPSPRGGVPLSEWLRRLVAAGRPTRRAAGGALEAMVLAVPSIHTPLEDISTIPDPAARGAAFEAEAKAALADPTFPLADFV